MQNVKILVTTILLLLLPHAGYSAGDGKMTDQALTSLKVVVHVNFNDPQRQIHGLKNIRNILKEDPRTVVEVVCHGNGLSLLIRDGNPATTEVAALMKDGVLFLACENTMREKKVTPDGLIAGVKTVPSGALEVVRKQQEGYSYFVP